MEHNFYLWNFSANDLPYWRASYDDDWKKNSWDSACLFADENPVVQYSWAFGRTAAYYVVSILSDVYLSATTVLHSIKACRRKGIKSSGRYEDDGLKG